MARSTFSSDSSNKRERNNDAQMVRGWYDQLIQLAPQIIINPPSTPSTLSEKEPFKTHVTKSTAQPPTPSFIRRAFFPTRGQLPRRKSDSDLILNQNRKLK